MILPILSVGAFDSKHWCLHISRAYYPHDSTFGAEKEEWRAYKKTKPKNARLRLRVGVNEFEMIFV